MDGNWFSLHDSNILFHSRDGVIQMKISFLAVLVILAGRRLYGFSDVVLTGFEIRYQIDFGHSTPATQRLEAPPANSDKPLDWPSRLPEPSSD